MRLILLSLLIILVAVAVSAEDDSNSAATLRHHPAVTEFEDYRPVGDLRRWELHSRTELAGEYRSEVLSEANVHGRHGYVIQHGYTVESTFRRQKLDLKMRGEHRVADNFGYLGTSREAFINGATEAVELARRGDSIVGTITRNDSPIDQATYFDFAEPGLAYENNFVDLLEAFLARTEFSVGDSLIDTVFVPTMLIKMTLKFRIKDFREWTMADGTTDSVFIVNFSPPVAVSAMLTADNRLVSATIPTYGLEAVLVEASNLRREIAKPKIGFGNWSSWLPAVLIYIVMGVWVWLLLVGAKHQYAGIFTALGVGAASFVLIPWTQTPLQMALFDSVLLPKVRAGGSPYIWSLLPAMAGGIVQELLRLVVVFGLLMLRNIRPRQLVAVAAAAGVGFGIVESCYLLTFAAGDPLSWSLVERAVLIVFHTIAGGLLGRALASGTAGSRWLSTFFILIAANTFLRYIPIFVQQGVVSLELLYLVMGILALMGLALVLMVLKRPQRV